MTTTDYTTDATMINGGITLLPTTKLALTLTGNYSTTEASFDPVEMPDAPADALENIEAPNYDYSMIHTYSDMSYKYLDATVRLDYSISPTIKWNANLSYLKFTDDTGYIYGDETGSLMIVGAGLEYGF